MSEIPTVTFQILGPNEGAAENSPQSLWFKIKSDPPPPRGSHRRFKGAFI